jgi:putative ABC transport system permease protein
MNAFSGNVRFALRQLRTRPGFAVAAILTLGIGIGAATAIFTVVNGVLLRSLPHPEPDRIVRLWQVGEDGGRMHFSQPNFDDVAREAESFAYLARIGRFGLVSVVGGAEPARAFSAAVSQGFLGVMGVSPAVGRSFVEEEMQEGGRPAAMVSHDFWERRLGAPQDLSGLTLTFHNRVHQVVGVMPPGFDFPSGVEIWWPAELIGPESRTGHNWQAWGRLAPGRGLEAAAGEFSAIARRVHASQGDQTWMVDGALVSLHEEVTGGVRPALVLLLGASALLLVIAYANVVNLLLARAAGRRRELSVRRALGASRGPIIRQFVTESAVLCAFGAVLGLLIANWGLSALLALEPGRLPRAEAIHLDLGVLLFAAAVAASAALGMGVLTALRATSGPEVAAVGERAGTADRAGRRLRGGLVVSQTALTLVLLVGAGLLGRSFLQLLAVDPGYRTEGVVLMDLSHPYPETEAEARRLVDRHVQILDRLRGVPGADEVGGANDVPLGGNYPRGSFLELTHPDEVRTFEDFAVVAAMPERVGSAEYRVVSDGFFRAMGIPLLTGRLFDDRDQLDAPHVAVISESLARSRWPGQDPIGKLVQFGNMDGDLRAFEIVGVVGDVREGGLGDQARPTLYGDFRQRVGSSATFTYLVHGSAAPEAVMAAGRAAARSVAPDAPPRFRLMEDMLSSSVADRRFTLLLLGSFAVTAFLLAVLGIYAVVAFTVGERTREIGIRMALGAEARDVVGRVVTGGVALAGAGAALGLLGGLALSRTLEAMLFQVSRFDPVSFGLAAVLLIGAAAMAAWIPARRAARVDPMIALRSE